jgi:ubiquinone/menaquinone biosynthesis C-methylase UbiE
LRSSPQPDSATFIDREARHLPDNHYVNSKLAEIYDLDSGWSIDRDFYLKLASPEPQKILDLGCGTGLLCDAYAARNHNVTGVDPSPAMLEIACRKPNGKRIDWVQSFAQTYRSDKNFDLIIMTGHAFQVLLEDGDITKTFETMHKHLNRGGVVAFESRNPSINWEKEWNYDMAIALTGSSESIVYESRRFLSMRKGRMTFELSYKFPDETLTSLSELRFSSHDDIIKLLSAAGLRIDKVFGDWNGSDYDERSSLEMIFIARAD